jgi:alpha-tubulin suppressor-like RCC1 family protein
MRPNPGTRRRSACFFQLSAFVLFLLLPLSEGTAQCVQKEAKADRHEGRNNLSLELISAQPRTVSVNISGPGIEKPLRFELCAGQGKEGAGMHVPPGKDRRIELLVLDAQRQATHRGMTSVTVREGPIRSVNVNLVPVQGAESLRATIGTYRMDVRQEVSKDGKFISYRVEVLDPNGRAVNIRADEVTLRAANEPITPIHPKPTPKPAPHLNMNSPIRFPNVPIVICYTVWQCHSVPPPLPLPINEPTSFQAIAAGGGLVDDDFTCALDSGGQAWCWGDDAIDFPFPPFGDTRGRLGSEFRAASSCTGLLLPCSLVPLPVQGGHTFTSITAGWDFTCGIDTAGVAWCWGADTSGELGISGGPFPEQVGGTPFANAHHFFSLSAGGNHACGVTTDNRLFCWGHNTSGELGLGRTNPVGPFATTGPPSLVNIPGETQVSAVAAGSDHTCAITGDAAMFCWGDDQQGQLGIDPTTTPTDNCSTIIGPESPKQCMLIPAKIQFGSSKASGLWDRVSAGDDFTCGRDQTTSQIFCWGSNTAAQLGTGSPGSALNPLPVPVVTPNPFTAFDMIASHEGQTCALQFKVSGPDNLVCWGTFVFGQPVGPTSVPGHKFIAFSPGSDDTCAIDADQSAWCFGRNNMGQLGDGTTTDSPTPVKVAVFF